MNQPNPFEEFNQTFFSTVDTEIYWYNKEGAIVLNKDFIALLSLDDPNVKRWYSGYRVKIINGDTGNIIANKSFGFDEYITHWEVLTQEGRQPYVSLLNGTIEWFNSRPRDTNTMLTAIFDFINEFKECS